jgi:hypothetical protein
MLDKASTYDNLIIKKWDLCNDKVNKAYDEAVRKGLVNNEFLLVCGFEPDVSLMGKAQKFFVMKALYFSDIDLLDNIEQFFNENKKVNLLIIEDINLCFKYNMLDKELIFKKLNKICGLHSVCGFISDLH